MAVTATVATTATATVTDGHNMTAVVTSNGFAGDPDPRAFHGATATSEKSRARACRFMVTEPVHFVTATWTRRVTAPPGSHWQWQTQATAQGNLKESWCHS